MVITLPHLDSGHVWVASPTWLYDQWHWLWVLAFGISAFVIAVISSRVDRKSFPAGLLLVLSLGPTLVGLVAGIGSYRFWHHPTPFHHVSTWSATHDAAHQFRVPVSHIGTTRYTDPVHDLKADRQTINTDLGKAFGITILRHNQDAVFVPIADEKVLSDKAQQAPPYLINGQVYTCAFVTSGITRDKNNQITQIDVERATCVKGEETISITPQHTPS